MGNVREGRARRMWPGSRPHPPGHLHVSTSGLGMFGDVVRGAIGVWQKGKDRREEPGGQGTAGRNLAGVREELKRPDRVR